MSSRANVSRRGFLRLSAATAAGTSLLSGGTPPPGTPATPAAPTPNVELDLTRKSGALEPDAVVRATCQFCNSLCGLQVLKKGGRIIDIKGETADPVQDGNLCVKGPMMAQIVYNGNRICTPLRRVSGKKGSPDSRFEPIA